MTGECPICGAGPLDQCEASCWTDDDNEQENEENE